MSSKQESRPDASVSAALYLDLWEQNLALIASKGIDTNAAPRPSPQK